MTQEHRLSGMERLWLVADRLHPPFVNQMVLEGDGIPVPPVPWPELLARVADALPGARARLHGHLGASRWVADGPAPPAIEVDASRWDGSRPEGAPFLAAPLDPRDGPTCAIVIARGDPARVVVRTHHALMDGQGTMLLGRALFAALRSEPLARAEVGPLTDAGIARRLSVAPERIPPPDSAAPQGGADGAAMAVTWGRRRVEGRPSKLLPRIALALARMAPRPAGRTFRIAIPVDLRRHAPEVVSTSNLTGLLRIEADSVARGADPLGALAAAIKAGVASAEPASVALATGFARHLPVSLMAGLARLDARRSLRQGRYGSAAILSNLGQIPMDAFSGAGFQARRCFFVPPGNPGLPLFLAITGDEGGVELCATVPVPLTSGGRLDALLDALSASLAGS
ncbi:MAG: hypothetical protein U0166_10420 [Acidobacteriota bacterium]